MDWTQQVDGYCERLDPGLWAEPLNAVTNLAFLIAAFAAWRLVRHDGLPLAKLLVLILTLIGIGSGLFHTFATIWASLADTLPILAFILMTITGLMAFNRLDVQNFPDMSLPTITISASLDGAAAAQLETEVARKIEDQLTGLAMLEAAVGFCVAKPIAAE